MKNSPLSDKIRLLHILDAIAEIEGYLANILHEDFLNSSLIKNATLMQIQIIGEAVSNITDVLKNQHPDIEWKQIKGTRNIIAHEYFGIDYEIVWEIANNSLPELKEKIQILLDQLP